MYSADAANLISVDFRSVRSRLLDFLAKEMLIGHLSRENVIGRKTVELTMRPTVKLGHGLFKNTDDVVIRIRLLWEEILVLHGLIPGLGHTVGVDYFYLSDDSSDHNVFSFEEYGNLCPVLIGKFSAEIHRNPSRNDISDAKLRRFTEDPARTGVCFAWKSLLECFVNHRIL